MQPLKIVMEFLPPPTTRAATSPLIPAITMYLPLPFPSPSSGYLSTPSQPNLISFHNYFTKKLLFTNTGYQTFCFKHLTAVGPKKQIFPCKFLCFERIKYNPSLLPSLNLSNYNFKINVLFTPPHLAQSKTPMNPY
jgi:hypothetical protein